ncbi:hypothetical protein [Streptomyces sp. NPDC093018]|uniref:hypothetical protein n=1 Tax=Streptomyces sp. NPDC093018 TaxID=3155067 RepID=UPI00343B56FE
MIGKVIMFRRATLATAVTVAALAIPLASTPASAAETSLCGVMMYPAFRATGFGSWSYQSKTVMKPVELNVTDTYGDGYAVGIRLRTQRLDGSIHNWTWHKNTDGHGKTSQFVSSATDSGHIVAASVQVGVFNGSKLLQSCYSDAIANPYT